MAYSADTFVADEQPTTAKWNKLWSNDASFNDGTGIADDAIIARHISAFDKSNLSNGDSNPYKFAVRRNAAANTGNGSFAKVSFDTEIYDTNNNFASGTYTAPVDGYYLLMAGLAAGSTATNQRVILSLYKNGSEERRISTVWSSAGSQNLGPSGSAIIQLNATETAEVYVFGTGALVIDVASAGLQPFFMGCLLSRT